MKKSTLTLTLLLVGGAAQADPLPHGAWQGQGRLAGPGYLQMQPRSADPRREVIEEIVPLDPTEELLRRLKDEDFEPQRRVEPRPVVEVVPASEDAARRQFYEALREHAGGSGTLREVEGAYQHLLPYRR